MSQLVRCAALASLVLVACNDDPSFDNGGIIIAASPTQPQTDSLGTLLTIRARGGQSLAVAIEHGTFTSSFDVAGDAGVPSAQTFQCFAVTTTANSTALFSIELLVTPQESESLLFITLYDSTACGGTGISNRTLPVSKPGSNTTVIDAGGKDA